MKISDLSQIIEDYSLLIKDFKDWDVLIEIEPFAKIKHTYSGFTQTFRLAEAHLVIIDYAQEKIGICHNGDDE